MNGFTDATGQHWPVAITFATVHRVREVAGVDLLKTEGLRAATENILTFVNAIYAVCKPTADSRNINDEQFGELLLGAFPEARDAMLQGLDDFFRQLGQTALAVMIRRMRSWTKSREAKSLELVENPEVTAKMEAALEREMATTRTKMLAELDRIAGETSIDSPASSRSPTSDR